MGSNTRSDIPPLQPGLKCLTHTRSQQSVYKKIRHSNEVQLTAVKPELPLTIINARIAGSLRSWRYCVGARLKFWRRSRVPKKGSRDEEVEIPPARKPRYFEWSAHQCAGKRIGRGPYICQSCKMSLRVYFPI